MGIKQFFTNLLDKKPYSSYPEILWESVLVLWFACQICLKIGLRVLPEWGTSRLDQDTYSPFDYLLQRSGLKVDECFWDDALSGWIQPHLSTAARLVSSGTSGVLPLASTRILGYAVTITTIVLAGILSVSLVYLAVVNRHWTQPLAKNQLPYCRRFATQIQKYIKYATRIQLSDCMVFGLHVAVGIVSFVVYYPGWMIFNALIVFMAWMFVTLAINIAGPSAVFPGCIMFSSILTVYCIGRIWGLWMNNTYAALIKKGVRKLTAAKSTEKPLSNDAPLEKTLAGNDRKHGRGRWGTAACYMIAFCIGCIVVSHNVDPLFNKFPAVVQWLSSTVTSNTGSSNTGSNNTESGNTGSGNAGSSSTGSCNTRRGSWTYWQVVSTTGNCTKPGTRFGQEITMLSYWVDLQSAELRSMPASSNTALLLSFTPSFSPAVGWTFLVWSGVLSGLSRIPIMAMRCAVWSTVVISVMYSCGLLLWTGVRACCKKSPRDVKAERSSRSPRDVKAERSSRTENRKQSPLLTADVSTQETDIANREPSAHLPELINVTIDDTRSCTVPSDHLLGDTIGNQKLPEAKDSHAVEVSIECAPNPNDAAEPSECGGLCDIWGYRKLGLLLVICPLLCGWVLPYPVVGLFLPERLQLPGLLLLLTAYSIWMYCKLVQFVRLTWRDWCCCTKKLEGCCFGRNRAQQPSPHAEECVRLS
ncbi:uncharacterized protein LOC129582913 [Paramacrobiotus metropolitanus]|uniref:uncharacterized protein LOC129582913 n=1 Tax=Paramacrobiotus metropolitanus TaxID=2943436 RepID=UPI0024464116|nr:uncharacterized protein LOC129582913 [Paramacrobiotus metropolitanus]